jgi:hypothetical protein
MRRIGPFVRLLAWLLLGLSILPLLLLALLTLALLLVAVLLGLLRVTVLGIVHRSPSMVCGSVRNWTLRTENASAASRVAHNI